MATGPLFAFLKGDDLTAVVRDAAGFAEQHDENVAITYGSRRYEIHRHHTSEDALSWLIDRMQADAGR